MEVYMEFKDIKWSEDFLDWLKKYNICQAIHSDNFEIIKDCTSFDISELDVTMLDLACRYFREKGLYLNIQKIILPGKESKDAVLGFIYNDNEVSNTTSRYYDNFDVALIYLVKKAFEILNVEG